MGACRGSILCLLPQTVPTPLATCCYRANDCGHHLSARDQEQPPMVALGCVRSHQVWGGTETKYDKPLSPQVPSNVQEALGLPPSSCVIMGKYPSSQLRQDQLRLILTNHQSKQQPICAVPRQTPRTTAWLHAEHQSPRVSWDVSPEG